jgi:hypothetical protein
MPSYTYYCVYFYVFDLLTLVVCPPRRQVPVRRRRLFCFLSPFAFYYSAVLCSPICKFLVSLFLSAWNWPHA